MRHHLGHQPGGVGGETARWQMVEPHVILQVPDGVLDFGVVAVVGLENQGIPLLVGDQGVIAASGEQTQLGAGRVLHQADDGPHRHGVGLGLKGCVFDLRHIGGAVHPVEMGLYLASGMASIRCRRL